MSFWKDPFFHFVVGGAALFGLYAWVGDPSPRDARIVVDERQVANLANTFERVWSRPPTGAELDGLVAEHIKEEVLYREALALGLDENDLIIRRRLRQKMEFLARDLAEASEASDAELAEHLAAHPEVYRLPPKFSLEQVYLDPQRSDGNPRARADALLRRLEAGADPAGLGDPTMLPARLEGSTPPEVSRHFGGEFAAALETLSIGQWGHVPSSFGLHLVRLAHKEPGRMPALDEVRDAVVWDVSSVRRAETDDAFYRALRDRYEVEVWRPADSDLVSERAP